jgi:hypothetical protein
MWMVAVAVAALGGVGCQNGSAASKSMPDESLVPVKQVAPAGGFAQSQHYKLVATMGPSVDNSAATSQHYRLQAGLTGANITLP